MVASLIQSSDSYKIAILSFPNGFSLLRDLVFYFSHIEKKGNKFQVNFIKNKSKTTPLVAYFRKLR